MLTQAGGPVVISEKTLRALLDIRREKFLPLMYRRVVIARSSFNNFVEVFDKPDAKPPWLDVEDDCPGQEIPSRITVMEERDESSETAIKLGLAIGASVILLEGPIKEKAKLSFIKSEGALSILVWAYRQGWLSAVKPMVKALKALGHDEVLPDEEKLQALWEALDKLE